MSQLLLRSQTLNSPRTEVSVWASRLCQATGELGGAMLIPSLLPATEKTSSSGLVPRGPDLGQFSKRCFLNVRRAVQKAKIGFCEILWCAVEKRLPGSQPGCLDACGLKGDRSEIHFERCPHSFPNRTHQPDATWICQWLEGFVQFSAEEDAS